MLLPWERGFAVMILQRRVISPLSLATAALSPGWDSSFIREAVKNLDPLPNHEEVKTASISAKTTGRPAFSKATRTLEQRSGSLLMFYLWRRTLPLYV